MAITVEKGLVSKSALTAIGNAIRAKNGSTTKYKPSEMAAAISELKTGDFTVATSDKFNFKVVQSAYQIINSTPVGKTVSNSDGTVSLALTDTTTISPNTNYIPGTIQKSYDDSTHTYTVTATDAEPIDGLVQNGWSVVYQLEDEYYSNSNYTGHIGSSENLQGNILIGGMGSNNAVGYPKRVNNMSKFKNTFVTNAKGTFLLSCGNLTYVELPNLTSAGDSLLQGCENLTHVELPNLTSAGIQFMHICYNLRSVETPKLTTLSGNQYQLGSSSNLMYFIDFGYTTNIAKGSFYYTQVMVLRAETVPANFAQSKLSDPVLYIVPSALVDAYKSKVRSKDYVTALEKSPFADGKTVCGNDMETSYVYGTDGETLGLDEEDMLWFDGIHWQYVSGSVDTPASKIAGGPSGFYFLSKLTKERGYTIPT